MHSISFFFFVLLFLLFSFLFLFLESKYQPRMKKKDKKKNEIMFRNMIKVDSNNDNNTIRNFSMFYFIQGSDQLDL